MTGQPSVTLLTGTDLHIDDAETPALAAALADRGVRSRIVEWRDAAAMAEPSDLLVIRATWDYTTRVDEFVTALRAAPAPVANPVEVVEWNLHKGYLVELAAAGVPVVPTVLIRPGDDPPLGTGAIILKPTISAGARGLGRFDAGDPAAAAHLSALLSSGDVLLQPFLPDILDGETSLLFFGGVFSHAVRKVPAVQDFRVQGRHGGVTTAWSATEAELAVAAVALAQIAAPLLYARVDLVSTATGPLLMELELIEPDLFLSYSPGAFGRFADAIERRLQ